MKMSICLTCGGPNYALVLILLAFCGYVSDYEFSVACVGLDKCLFLLHY